jgi:mono/diheme cytochrome c family protein
MRVVRTWIGIGIGIVVALLALGLGTTWALSDARMNRSYEVAVVAPRVPTDAASLAEGERLVVSRGCTDCHGEDLGGAVMSDDPLVGRLWATNLTSGAGGVGSTYDDEDFARAIWYGVRPDGTALAMMPSSEYHQALDEVHLGRMLAFLRAAPPVDRETPPRRIGPLAWTGHVLGFFPLAHVERIDLAEPPIAPIPVAATVEYGASIGVLCTGCHGADLAGFSDPGIGVAPNLTPHPSGLGDWTADDLQRALREGRRPDGSTISDAMPWRSLARLTDTEIEALWAYLRSLEPLPSALDSAPARGSRP